ncbi:MAG: hypothetical protein MUO62_06125 [Anaerolineales bacterium]|nr:hypothetical protein [Anaerolineales bacterium]
MKAAHNQTANTCIKCPRLEPKQTIVVKVSRLEGLRLSTLCRDVANLTRQGHEVTLVCEGIEEVNLAGVDPNSLTDMDAFAREINGTINTQVVSKLQSLGVNAFGLSGLDGQLIKASPDQGPTSPSNGNGKHKPEVHRWEIETVNMGLLCLLVGCGYTPVIAPIAVNPDGEAVFIDAEQAAARVAAALRADILVLLSEPIPLPASDMRLGYNHSHSNWDGDEAYALSRRTRSPNLFGPQNQRPGSIKQIITADGLDQATLSEMIFGKENRP